MLSIICSNPSFKDILNIVFAMLFFVFFNFFFEFKSFKEMFLNFSKKNAQNLMEI